MAIKKNFVWILGLSLAGMSAGLNLAHAAEQDSSRNPLFYYTHLLPSPFTVSAGTLVLGTEAAYGVTDFFQVGTSLINDLYKVVNINARLSLLSSSDFALGVSIAWESYNYHDISDANPDQRVNSWQPGLVTAFAIDRDIALFVGGNLNYSKPDINSDIQSSGYVHGATVEADASWAYNLKGRRLGNVLSGGTSYDLSYKILGLGVSHHWQGFQVGFHYYPNASQYKIVPIFAAGIAVDI